MVVALTICTTGDGGSGGNNVKGGSFKGSNKVGASPPAIRATQQWASSCWVSVSAVRPRCPARFLVWTSPACVEPQRIARIYYSNPSLGLDRERLSMREFADLGEWTKRSLEVAAFGDEMVQVIRGGEEVGSPGDEGVDGVASNPRLLISGRSAVLGR